jgi:thiol:disulfide interchange protein
MLKLKLMKQYKWLFIVGYIGVVLVAVGCKVQPPSTTGTTTHPVMLVNFEQTTSFESVLQKSKAQHKPVFVDFYTTWCMPCKLMDEEVFAKKISADYLNQYFINYKVDAEKGKGPDLAAIFEVKAYPTTLFLDSNGVVLVRKEGATMHTELTKLGNEAVARYNGER